MKINNIGIRIFSFKYKYKNINFYILPRKDVRFCGKRSYWHDGQFLFYGFGCLCLLTIIDN